MSEQQKTKIPKARLICVDSSQIAGTPAGLEFALDPEKGAFALGRGEDCEGTIECRKLSRRHARIVPENGRWVAEDLNSTNGVFINGSRTMRNILEADDEIKFGPVAFEFRLAGAYAPIEKSEGDTLVDETVDDVIDVREETSAELPDAGEDDDGESTMMLGALDAHAVLIRSTQDKREAATGGKVTSGAAIAGLIVGMLALAGLLAFAL